MNLPKSMREAEVGTLLATVQNLGGELQYFVVVKTDKDENYWEDYQDEKYGPYDGKTLGEVLEHQGVTWHLY